MDISRELNSKQQEAVMQTEGPVLVLAGAGSGKTRVLTHRIAYLIQEKEVSPWNILAITFTNKAAREMRERVNRLVGVGAEQIWVSTFHSCCVRILRRYIDRLGFSLKFSIYDTEDQKTLIKEICKKCGIDTKEIKEKMVLSAISKAKNEMISPKEFAERAGKDICRRKIAAAYQEYQIQLKENQALDFDDLLCKTVELFEQNPDILEYYQKRFLYLMVDEYQDTNLVQFRFIYLLGGRNQNVCVVGDDDQSIYRFRGADIRNILEFEVNYPKAVVIKLEQNYRSTKNILEVANQVIRNNQGRKEKTLWTEQDAGEKIGLFACENGNQEAERVAGEIQKRVTAKELAYQDCAVLYRTNAQSRILEERFIKENIPYRIFGGINFYARKEIKDLLAYLRTIENGKDDLSVKRIINVPKRGIGMTSIERVQEFANQKKIDFFEALSEAGNIPRLARSAKKMEEFVQLIQTFRKKIGTVSLKELLEEIIETIAYRMEFDGDEEEMESRNQNIDELISKIADYEANTENPSLSEFLEQVALIADIDALDDTKDYVVLMTLHSAKGLEFPKVFLCGMEEGIFPSYFSISSGNTEDLEEERRLCYVGITRAMKSLTISYARERMLRGETQYRLPSRFLKEISSQLLKGFSPIPTKITEMPKQEAYQRAKTVFQTKPFADKPKQQFGGTEKEPLAYTVGDTVFHIRYGKGIVQEIVSGGRDFEVTVEFERAGRKKMFASFAQLKKESPNITKK
ncbi:MAG: DNA helicase PcrA [Lachnospiraceae bacterium]|nr:DNA helicase PcrA [Lachnospiraceae bacterium]